MEPQEQEHEHQHESSETVPTVNGLPLDEIINALSERGKIEFDLAWHKVGMTRALKANENLTEALTDAYGKNEVLVEQVYTLDQQVQALMRELHGVQEPDQGRPDHAGGDADQGTGASTLLEHGAEGGAAHDQ